MGLSCSTNRGYNATGFSLVESVYEKCLLIEMRRAGLQAESQKDICVNHEEEVVEEFVADIVVEDIVVVEPKLVENLAGPHEPQLPNCPVATGTPVGRRLDVAERRVEVRRRIKDLKPG